MKLIDDFLNVITMYRLVLYGLCVFWLWALIFSSFGFFSFSPLSFIFSSVFILAICWITNKIFSFVFEVPTNIESNFITAFILILLISPIKTFSDLPPIFWISSIAMASKYILAINKKHIFNPAAIAILIAFYSLNFPATWWIGTGIMAPIILVVGFLIIRKLRRWDLILSFMVVSLATIFTLSFLKGSNLMFLIKKTFLDSPILFFAFIMLSEPLTTPPTRFWRILYGGLVGFLFAPQLHFGSFFTTPEFALCMGNVFSYLVSPKIKLLLSLKEKIQIAPDIYDFVFGLDKKLNFSAGQYMEWTLAHKNPDSRGNRRYFTVASSPTEDTLRIGVKFYPNASSFKRKLVSLEPGEKIVASSLSGDFTLPEDTTKKLVFIAGGIGITPFRSIVKSLLDKGEKRDIVLIYSNKLASDIVYKDLFDSAAPLGLKTVYTLTETESLPAGWNNKVGIVTPEIITAEVPDLSKRTFYISGPHSMVTSFESTLRKMGIPPYQIKVDYFPGFV